MQFENVRIGDRQIQLLGEYFAVLSPDGHYTQDGEWFGVGFYLYFKSQEPGLSPVLRHTLRDYDEACTVF